MPDKTFSDETTSNSDAKPHDSTGPALENTGDDVPEGDTVRSFARAAAQRVNAGADYVRNGDPKRVMADVRTVVTDHPGLALIAAAAGGFLLGRVLSRD